MRQALRWPWLVLIGGCAAQPKAADAAREKEHARAVSTICFVDQQLSFDDSETKLERSRKRSSWLDAVAEPETVYLKTLLSVKPSTEQAKLLREEAKDHALPSCPLADEIEQDELAALSP